MMKLGDLVRCIYASGQIGLIVGVATDHARPLYSVLIEEEGGRSRAYRFVAEHLELLSEAG